MTLSDEHIKEIIPELDILAERAREIAQEIDSLQDRLGLHQDETLCKTYNAASQLAGTLQTTSDDLKIQRTDWIKDNLTSWHRFRIDDLDEITDAPVYESVAYRGHDRWVIIMRTPTHGRERIVLHACDGVNWPGVYSADQLKETTIHS